MAEEDAYGQELRLRRRELRHMEHEDVLSFIQTQVQIDLHTYIHTYMQSFP